MSLLSDHVERITLLARSIRSTALAVAPSTTGPYTQAVLYTPLGDLIRDVDSAEIRLFSLVPAAAPAASADNLARPHGEITRAEFHGATPLKKLPAPRMGRHERTGEHEPDVYARAALKYLNRYQSIRPMPRAFEQAERIMDQLATVRANIRDLSDTLKQHGSADHAAPLGSPKSLIQEEERRIKATQAQTAELKSRKETLLKQNAAKTIRPPRPKPRQHAPTAPDTQEESFWNTPDTAARTLHFTGDSLLDEQVDIGDVSTVSFATPLPARVRSRSRSTPRPKTLEETLPDEADPEPQPEPEPEPAADEQTSPIEGEENQEAEQTVTLEQPHPASPSQDVSIVSEATEEPPTPSPSPRAEEAETPLGSSRHQKVRITEETERIAVCRDRISRLDRSANILQAKIWSSIGDLIMPGNPFGASASKPPRAKETIAHLQSLASRTPAPPSPSTSFSSLSATIPSSPSNASVQQILTAHMLLALLHSPPSYAMSLGKLKETLSTKSAETGINTGGVLGGSGLTRPIYGCVAKRLLKIERGGGEQVVKFDV
ncbi:hypothetical protein WOLCODRAFT_132982 [Wolfiporia cocos MD-104 SS10]|uniref:Uncharacterized protein n=1 Tax=Wolfiporia cocos (strain MD-104) TaxID=742152 RepID=A0A2H3K463_WOLCO|nr:hypothetical protein WOLCODRAFT_132982 [Wolfiporia cocos MD-104 SS10]